MNEASATVSEATHAQAQASTSETSPRREPWLRLLNVVNDGDFVPRLGPNWWPFSFWHAGDIIILPVCHPGSLDEAVIGAVVFLYFFLPSLHAVLWSLL